MAKLPKNVIHEAPITDGREGDGMTPEQGPHHDDERNRPNGDLSLKSGRGTQAGKPPGGTAGR
jgi:hypothetical protein